MESTTSTLDLTDELRMEFFDGAVRVADWMVNNQVTNGYDANHGRFPFTVNSREMKIESYSSNWMTGVSVMGMLMMYHRTGDVKYLEAAKRGGEYIKTLQILDTREPKFFGALREDSPQSNWCHPRDGLTGVWGLLWLYEETKEPEYLERIKMFNSWFVGQAMSKGWPAWSFYFYDRQPDFLQGSFHGGDGAYFFDYYRIVGDPSYIDNGMRFIVDYAMEKFIGPDGKVRVIFDGQQGKYIEDGVTFDGMQKMHRHNDDFMSISILDAYFLFGEDRYLERVEAYVKWLISEQREDGGFGKPDVPPAAATGPILLADLYRITMNPEYQKAAIKAAKFLLSLQENSPDNKLIHGGFYGYGNSWNSGQREIINLRTSTYALIALLKLEGVEKGPYYSPFDRKGNFIFPQVKP